MQPPMIWLITGASSGFGRALTEVLLHNGHIVVATLRKPSVLEHLTKQYPPSQLLLLTLDVTRPSDISAAFTRTQEVFGRLDVVFNNAGYGMLGEVECIPDADARALFEVNFWGVVGVSRAAVRFFREVNPPGKGGILLQNSSMFGFVGESLLSFYCASKHAVGGFSESFSKEILPEWNIKIYVLQPGIFDTNILAATQFLPPHSAYANSSSATAALRDVYRKTSLNGDPFKFADMVYQLVVWMDSGKVPQFLPIGRDALKKLQDKLEETSKTLADVAPWSADLEKDHFKTTAKL